MSRILPVLLAACTWAPAMGADPDAGKPSPWTWDLRLGAFLQNIGSHNARESRDPAIAGTRDDVSYKFSGSGSVVWREGRDRFEQRGDIEYGEIRTQDSGKWTENADRLSTTVIYERTLVRPHFVYLKTQADSVFTGPDPDNAAFDPLIVKGSLGYGQRHEGLLPLRDALVGRAGVYVRKRWEQGAPGLQTRVAVGPELLLRYERDQSEDVAYFAQAEVLGEFADPGHAVATAEGGIDVKVGAALAVVLKARAYYESRPEAVGVDVPGYDEWSLKEEALLGLLWTIGSASR